MPQNFPKTVPNRTLGSSAIVAESAGSALSNSKTPGISTAINGFNSIVNNVGNTINGLMGNSNLGSSLFGDIASVITGEIGSVLGNVLGNPGGTFDNLVRIGFKPGHPYAFYPGILNPLANSGGVIFPYRPTIDITRSVNYDNITPIHSMQDYKSFRNNSSVNVMISGQYTAQNYEEARYIQAVLHFFKVSSLMSFGTGGAVMAGMPPPVLNFNAYGPNNAYNVPVLLDAVAQSYPNDVDYIRIDGNDIPTMITIAANMTVQLSPGQLRNFNLDAFAAGNTQNYI